MQLENFKICALQKMILSRLGAMEGDGWYNTLVYIGILDIHLTNKLSTGIIINVLALQITIVYIVCIDIKTISMFIKHFPSVDISMIATRWAQVIACHSVPRLLSRYIYF